MMVFIVYPLVVFMSDRAWAIITNLIVYPLVVFIYFLLILLLWFQYRLQRSTLDLDCYITPLPSSWVLSIFFFFSFSKACVQKPTLLLLWYVETVGSDAIFWVHGSMPTYFSLPLCLCGLVVQEKMSPTPWFLILYYSMVLCF